MANLGNLRQYFYQSLLGLATEEGINASAKDEVYGCIFGRDSAITVLKILRAHGRNPSEELLGACQRTLTTLISLQGQEFNRESGEEPGKFIHEFRRSKFEHLVNGPKPWFVYPDGILRNYDSVDSTSLALIAIYKYWQATADDGFLITVLGTVEAGLNWIITFGDRDKDCLVEYSHAADRLHGGLKIQSWTDSFESLMQPDGNLPAYPIAQVEVQAFSWLALKLWSNFYQNHSPSFAHKLASFAARMKERFNDLFIYQDGLYYFAAQALDGNKNRIETITGNPLICLWATYTHEGEIESIIEEKYITSLVERAFQPDLFDPDAGIRTMSVNSPTYNPNQDSYHNGSFWPMLNGLAHEGLLNWHFVDEADKLKTASLKPIEYFGTPIELYIKSPEGGFLEYRSPSGQTSCKIQAWSAATVLDWLT